MKFLYQPVLTIDPVSGDGLLAGRPEVVLTVHGERAARSYRALVDTGADRSVFPRSMADDLGIRLNEAKGNGGTTFSGETLSLKVGMVLLELADETALLRWPAAVLFHDFHSGSEESIVLGHAGFLEYFSATFDGYEGSLSLVPNADFPQPGK